MLATPEQFTVDYYSAQAREFGAEPQSTMPDEVVREKETAAILDFLDRRPPGRLLEIGCGNGFLLSRIAARFGTKFSLHGVDLTADLLAIARQRPVECDLREADLRHLPYPTAYFDTIVSERVVINILDPEQQVAAFCELARVLGPGGGMVAIEGFKSGLDNLNRARADFLLPPIPEPAVNNWFTPDRWRRCLETGFAEMSEAECAALAPRNFLSSHYFMTRFLHDALMPSGGRQRNTEMARFFAAALPPVGDYSPLQLHYLVRVP